MNSMTPQGYRFAGVHCGVKKNAAKLDLALVVSERDAAAAGVYTQNLVFAAPVGLDRARTPSPRIRAVVINSGNANACTGARGDQDAATMAGRAAATVGAAAEQGLVMSTGVIGQFLPLERIEAGIRAAGEQLATGDEALIRAAQAIMTTDTVHKVSSRQWSAGGRELRLCGFAKGAAMIGPNMATMLGLLFTDAAVAPADLQAALSEAVDDTFNCISVDGHMSTNDTVLLLANGAAGGAPLGGEELRAFAARVHEVCGELSRAIIADGEGATHLITIDVRGARDVAAARKIAKTVAESPLVKTAITGNDPNWGRIVSAVGYAGVPCDAARICLDLNGTRLYTDGAPVAFDDAAVSRSIEARRETSIVLTLGDGQAAARFLTTDLTAEYVRLNADYRT